jgi:short-subunit dehydrogenase
MKMKTIVITGASAGIGAELARRLGRDGHALVLAARRHAALEQVAAEARDAGASGVEVVEADVTKRHDVEHVRDRAVACFGGFDVWVNNAGRGIMRSTLDLTDADVDDVMAVNLKSALYGMQTAARYFMERGGGQIVNISSFLARVPMAAHRSAYNAAKAALNALTANLRMDLRRDHPNIHVTLVMPGMVATEFARNAIGAAPGTGVYAGSQVQSPGDVADAIAGVIERPVAEIYTNAASAEMARRYYTDVAAFEAGADNPWRSPPAAS